MKTLKNFTALFYFFLVFHLIGEESSENLQKGYECYLEGERADSSGRRQKLFNCSLSTYLSLANNSSPWLQFNIGNAFYQLEDYPRAILYYSRALKQLPEESRIIGNLRKAKQQLQLPIESRSSGRMERILSLNGFLPLKERLRLFLIWGALFLTGASIYIWSESKLLKTALGFSGALLILLLLNLALEWYAVPIRAVLISPSGLHQTPSIFSEWVNPSPIPAGSSVEILNALEEGEWLKVIDESGNAGYLPYLKARII